MTKIVTSEFSGVAPPRPLLWGMLVFSLCLVTTGILEILGVDIVEGVGGPVMVGIGILLSLLAIAPILFPSVFQTAKERVNRDRGRRCEQREVVFTREELRRLLANLGGIPPNDRNEESIPSEADNYWLCANYLSEQWRPGEIVHISRQGGFLARKPVYHVVFDWRDNRFRCGEEQEMSIPLNTIRQLRLYGKHTRCKGGRYSSYWQDRWHVCLDAIVDSGPIHLIYRESFIDPDTAYYSWLPLAATLAFTLDIPLRWAGFENHFGYRPPLVEPPETGGQVLS